MIPKLLRCVTESKSQIPLVGDFLAQGDKLVIVIAQFANYGVDYAEYEQYHWQSN